MDGRALRVLMYSPQFHPLQGGYERAAARVSAELAARGYAVQVVTERRERAWPAADRVNGVAVRRLPVVFRPGLHAASAGAALAAWLLPSLRRFDLLHAHTFGSQTAVAIAAARLLRVPVVLKLPSMGEGGVAMLAGRGPARAGVRALHRGVDACLAPSLAVRDEAVAFGIPGDRVHLLPNGIDTAAFRPASAEGRAEARRGLGIEGDGPLVLCIARLSPEKGLFTLLGAWERIAAAHPDARLAVVGDGPDRAALESAVAASPAAATVRIAGPATDTRPWYAAAALLVVPSDFEGFSNVLLEGMSAGLPVVATRVSGTVDVFAGAEVGEMVEPRDPAALAAALARMLDDGARRAACGVAARSLAERKYSLAHVVDELETIYAGVVRPAASRER